MATAQRPGESSSAYVERRIAERLEEARRRYLSSASLGVINEHSPTRSRLRLQENRTAPAVEAAAPAGADGARSVSVVSSLSAASTATLEMHSQRPAAATSARASPKNALSPARVEVPGLIHSSLWFHSNDPHKVLLPQSAAPLHPHAGLLEKTFNTAVGGRTTRFMSTTTSTTKATAVEDVSVLSTHRALVFPDPSPVRAAPILSSSTSSSISEHLMRSDTERSSPASSPGRQRRYNGGGTTTVDLVELICNVAKPHLHAKPLRDAPHYQHRSRSSSPLSSNGGVSNAHDAPGAAAAKHHYYFYDHQQHAVMDEHGKRHDEPTSNSFWITVWPGYYRNGQPAKICVSPRTTYFQSVLERAAAATRCSPAPTLLYTPSGNAVYDLDGLVPNGHYLIAPSAVKYHVDMVPEALLRRLVTAAENVVGGRRSANRPNR